MVIPNGLPWLMLLIIIYIYNIIILVRKSLIFSDTSLNDATVSYVSNKM